MHSVFRDCNLGDCQLGTRYSGTINSGLGTRYSGTVDSGLGTRAPSTRDSGTVDSVLEHGQLGTIKLCAEKNKNHIQMNIQISIDLFVCIF